MPAALAALGQIQHSTTCHRTVGHDALAGALRTIEGVSDAWPGARLAIHFLALTAARSGEVRGATWAEVDLDAATWTVPAARMKTRRLHRVPLSMEALDVLRRARQLPSDGEGLVFPSSRGKELPANALTRLIARAGLADTMTAHGLRASFRDFCADTNQDRALAEAALAHVVGGVEGAYFRSDLYERRRKLMDEWSVYLDA